MNTGETIRRARIDITATRVDEHAHNVRVVALQEWAGVMLEHDKEERGVSFLVTKYTKLAAKDDAAIEHRLDAIGTHRRKTTLVSRVAHGRPGAEQHGRNATVSAH